MVPYCIWEKSWDKSAGAYARKCRVFYSGWGVVAQIPKETEKWACFLLVACNNNICKKAAEIAGKRKKEGRSAGEKQNKRAWKANKSEQERLSTFDIDTGNDFGPEKF